MRVTRMGAMPLSRVLATGMAAGAVRLPAPGLSRERPAGPSWLPPGRDRLLGAPGAARRSRRLLVGLVSALATAVAVALGWGVVGGAGSVPAPVVPAVSFQNVGYRLLGVSVTRRIAQRGAPAVSASGVFAIVKLGLHSLDRRRHVVSTDLLALDSGGTYYDPSSPLDIGLRDRQWGAVSGSTPVAADGSLTVKVVFDVARTAFHRPVILRIGQFGPVGQPPPRGLELTGPIACCAPRRQPSSRERQMPARLVPDPVLGSAAPAGQRARR